MFPVQRKHKNNQNPIFDIAKLKNTDESHTEPQNVQSSNLSNAHLLLNEKDLKNPFLKVSTPSSSAVTRRGGKRHSTGVKSRRPQKIEKKNPLSNDVKKLALSFFFPKDLDTETQMTNPFVNVSEPSASSINSRNDAFPPSYLSLYPQSPPEAGNSQEPAPNSPR